MTFEIYPSECLLLRGEDTCRRWTEYRFVPRRKAVELTETGYLKIRQPMSPIRVSSTLATLTEDKKRLIFHNGNQYDAETVFLMARNNHKDVKFVP
jgi:hypothetical protein